LLGGAIADQQPCEDKSCKGGALLQTGADKEAPKQAKGKKGLQARLATLSGDLDSYLTRVKILNEQVGVTGLLQQRKPYDEYASLLHKKLNEKDIATTISNLEESYTGLKSEIETLENRVFGEEYDTDSPAIATRPSHTWTGNGGGAAAAAATPTAVPKLLQDSTSPVAVSDVDLVERANALEEVSHSCHFRIIKLEQEVTSTKDKSGLLVQHGASDHPTLSPEAALAKAFGLQAILNSLEKRCQILGEKMGVTVSLVEKDKPIELSALLKTKVAENTLIKVVEDLETQAAKLSYDANNLENHLLGSNIKTGLVETVTRAPTSIANRLDKLDRVTKELVVQVEKLEASTYR